MKELRFQTIHPQKGKKNKSIPADKYETVKKEILEILQYLIPTHTELINELHANLKKSFRDNISWYGMTVKLDLEARNIIQELPQNRKGIEEHDAG